MKVLVGLFCIIFCFSQVSFADISNDERQAIVKIYTTYALPDYYTPWNMGGPSARTGSGCIIEGNRILTNAHIVGDETYIEVRRYGDAKKYCARVLFVSHITDLALLSVDDESFFDGVVPLGIGALPEVQTEVTVLGFPLGGDMLSTTKGVVSRIEHCNYAHSSFAFLAGQIDAAINPGNSGGPVVVDGKIVGVVMQHLSSSDNIGYMVPTPVVKHFLTDVSDGHYDGIPDMGVRLGALENPDMKRKYGLPEDSIDGVRIQYITPGSASDGVLKLGDVILEVGGFEVADDGTVEFRKNERTACAYPVELRQIGESVPLKILRNGNEMAVDLKFERQSEKELLVPRDCYGVRPDYYIFGGVVFCPLTKDYLMAWRDWYDNAPKNLVYSYQYREPKIEGEEVVVVIRVLADDVNRGYHGCSSWIVDKVNGEKINNMHDLIEKVEAVGDADFVVFSDDRNNEMVLDKKKAIAAMPSILMRYRIPSDRSESFKKKN